ncbi:MAG: sulfite exporter TauE/SafE family protein [bacterium]
MTESPKLKTYVFHVHGMHCHSCVLLTERELGSLSSVSNIKTSLKERTITVHAVSSLDVESILEECNEKLRSYGYSLSLQKERIKQKFSEFIVAIPVAIGFIALFLFLQKIGLFHFGTTGTVTYGSAFIIGLVASVSTCMAIVGGLVLSLGATVAKEGRSMRPQILFHSGRILSFFVFGGLIGMLGEIFSIGTTATLFLSFLTGFVMLILGINLLHVFHWSKRLQFVMPKALSKHAFGMTQLNHTFTPFLIGVATFFLPCGFTQAMQVYTLTAGGFLHGGLIMGAFALGTLPVLAGISLSSFSITNSRHSGMFFKTVGIVVIFFALFTLSSSLALTGISVPTLSYSRGASLVKKNVYIVDGVQVIAIKAGEGYSPSTTIAKAGIPTIVRFTTNGSLDCSSSVRIPSLNMSRFLNLNGTTDVDLGIPKVGLLGGMCGMGMFPFSIDFK